MAFYPIECTRCGLETDVWQDMVDRGLGKPYPLCCHCGASTKRRYTRITIHGMDTERPPGTMWSRALSDDENPVYIPDRKTWKQLMEKRGVVPAEDGQAEAARTRHMNRVEELRRENIDESVHSAMGVLGEAGHAGVLKELRDNNVDFKEPEKPWELQTE